MNTNIPRNLLVFQDGLGFKTVTDFTREIVYQMVSKGTESLIGHNISYKDKPYRSGESAGTVVQSFQTELTERFIHEQL